jgi:hypothetical protein
MEPAGRMQERRPEIERAILTRVYSISDPGQIADPGYVSGLREAVAAAVDYGLCAPGDEPAGAVPGALLAQARLAARNAIPLDTVLRRYFAGYTLLAEFLMQEAERSGGLGAEEAKALSRAQATLFDRLVVAVTDAYTEEAKGRQGSTEHARAERVKRLLAGELLDDARLGYELGARRHLGAIAAGPGAPRAFRRLAAELDRRLLLVRPGEGVVWAWLGGAKGVSADEVARLASASWPEEVMLSIGQPAHGISGWRLTHRQALAAWPLACRSKERVVAYRDVALLAAALADEVLSSSLKETYLAPLVSGPDAGAALRQTLRTWFAAGRNISSTAAKLGVSRKTVASRIAAIEEKIGRSLETCAAEMETALRLQGLCDGQIR